MSRLSTTALLPQLPRDASQYDRELNAALQNSLANISQQINQLAEGRAVVHYNEDTAVPTSGSYRLGDFVRNSNPSEISGSTAVKYVLRGWVCVSNGSASATSFVQVRSPTGS